MGLFRKRSNNLKKRSLLTGVNKQLPSVRSINRSVIKNALRRDFWKQVGRRYSLKGWSADLDLNKDNLPSYL